MKPSKRDLEKRVLRAAMRLYERMPVTLSHVAMAYGPAHQSFWKACAALARKGRGK